MQITLNKIKKLLGEEKRFLKNVTNTSFKKNVLVSYTVAPFVSNKKRHTNCQESKAIVKIFKGLGFNVDVIHYTNKKKINYKKYNLLFGFGEPFENSFRAKNINITRIYYATGAHVCHQNNAEIKRVNEVNAKYNSDLLPKRLVPWNWSMSTGLSDALIVIGNEWTKSTYTKFTFSPVFSVNATALNNINTRNIKRDIKKTKKSFLWFGSSGQVHKGLDLCLEYFCKNKELKLNICGPMEEDFKRVFSALLGKENVFFYGFVDVESEKFIDIVSQCSFSILPSCSEGQATALLTTMGAGLIPIATKYSGIDVEKYGCRIDDLSVTAIDKAVNTVLALDNDTVHRWSKKNQNYIENVHTIISFERELKAKISEIINVKN